MAKQNSANSHPMRTFAFIAQDDDPHQWREWLARDLGPIELFVHPNIPDRPIDYVLAFRPPTGSIAKLRGAKVVFSLGAGVDGLADDATIPTHLPIVRMMDDGLIEGMTEFVLHGVLAAHREADDFARLQHAHRWDHRDHKFARERQVGVLGLGKLGGAAAVALRRLNFQVMGWSRTPRQIEGVECFHGSSGLAAMVRRTEILVCLLPLTPETERILNADLFAQLPRGAYVINVGRGKQCAIEDLVAALDAGQLGGALLDVFPEEPLPATSPLWDHPKLRITPHIAAMVMPRSATKYVVEQIRAFEAGRALVNLVDRQRGY
jgi:glyoxylate/hydroxypyruvate reductase